MSSEPSRSVRLEGTAPVVRHVKPSELFDAVAAEAVTVRHRHHNTGVVAPAALHEMIGAIGGSLVHGSILPRHRTFVARLEPNAIVMRRASTVGPMGAPADAFVKTYITEMT